MTTWHYVEDGEKKGPVAESTLNQMVHSGRLPPYALVWREGMKDWQAYQTMFASAADAVCVGCNRLFSTRELIRHSGFLVCAPCKPALVEKIKGGLIPPDSQNFASIWKRLFAKWVDGLLLSFGRFFLLSVPVSTFSDLFWPLVKYFLFYCAYNTIFLGWIGATPGKKLLGIRVVTAEGDDIGFWRAFQRTIAENFSAFFLIGYIMAIFDREKRSLHDRMCDTRVINF